jgi:hypothetical protein|nr:MAG TPA: YtxH-like protein [Caudoviricetes sp.]DAQ81354.1 MAG TPA: YtxH-like protein [Caudoviricetes sp.]DAX28468.1 MAG TPA: YtxH-like protein [Caudoviricetes sp.]
MLFAWFLVGLAAGLVVGVAGTYMYLDKKFQKSVEEVLNEFSERLAQFADE